MPGSLCSTGTSTAAVALAFAPGDRWLALAQAGHGVSMFAVR